MKKKMTFKEWRESECLSNHDLAMILDIPESTIIKWSNDSDREPRKVYRKALIRKFPDSPLSYL